MALRIKECISEHGLTIKEVAERMEISHTALLQTINGRTSGGKHTDSNPTVSVLEKISNAIGCEITELFESPKSKQAKAELSYMWVRCPNCGKELEIGITRNPTVVEK